MMLRHFDLCGCEALELFAYRGKRIDDPADFVLSAVDHSRIQPALRNIARDAIGSAQPRDDVTNDDEVDREEEKHRE